MRVWLLSSLFWVACGGIATSPDAGPEAPHASASCPPTLAVANGVACSADGLTCRMLMTCDAVNEIATCACAGGFFECRDSFGVVPKNADPVCASRAPADDSPCAPSMALATGRACDTVGKLCAYEGPICPESLTQKPALESCVCRGVGDGQRRYTCYPVRCLGN